MPRPDFLKIGERVAGARAAGRALQDEQRNVVDARLADLPVLVAYIHTLEQALQPFATYVEALPPDELRGEHVGVYVRCAWLYQAYTLLHATRPSGAPEAPVRRSQGETRR
jgi:hypothetical protein